MKAKGLSIGLAAMALMLLPAAQALAQAAPALPPEFARALGDWGVCRGAAVASLAKGSASVEAILAEASKRCAAEEATARGAAAKTLGAQAPAFVALAIQANDRQARELIDSSRSGIPVSDPSVAWGQCVGQQVNTADAKADPDAIVDKAFAACAEFEKKTVAYMDAHGAHEAAVALQAQARRMTRDQLAKTRGQARSGAGG
jgi:hypothetical protein